MLMALVAAASAILGPTNEAKVVADYTKGDARFLFVTEGARLDIFIGRISDQAMLGHFTAVSTGEIDLDKIDVPQQPDPDTIPLTPPFPSPPIVPFDGTCHVELNLPGGPSGGDCVYVTMWCYAPTGDAAVLRTWSCGVAFCPNVGWSVVGECVKYIHSWFQTPEIAEH